MEAFSAADPSSTADQQALPAASSRAHPVLPGSSPADLAPSIQHAPASQAPAALALQAHVLDSEHAPASADRVPVDSVDRVLEGRAELLPPEKLHVRSAPRTIEAVAVASNIRRLRKAR